MSHETHLKASRFVLAIAVAVVVVLSAPVVGQIRGWIRATFPGQFVLVVGGIGALILSAALAAAALRIREHRLRRYGAIAAAVALAIAYSAFNAGENPESNAVERFHFLEYGLITFLFYRAWRPLGDVSIVLMPVFAGLIVGTAEEWLQWFIPNRVGELNDIFLNLAAIVCGLLFSIGVEPPSRFVPRLEAGSRGRLGRIAAATMLALAAFIHVIHLGYVISDPEIGSFTSRYSPARLPALQREKTDVWALRPPPLVLERISREDQYLSEGLAHVRWRNRQWDAGNFTAAWKENLILEKYFVPVLDTPTYEGKQGHRWPPPQRADAEARVEAAGSSPSYVSEAYPYRIYTWSRTAFWTTVAVLIVALNYVLLKTAAPNDIAMIKNQTHR
jgi:hypothetical protein